MMAEEIVFIKLYFRDICIHKEYSKRGDENYSMKKIRYY